MRLKSFHSLFIFVFAVIFSGCSDRAPKTDLEKQSYAAGVKLAENFKTNGLKLDHGMVEQAVKDVFSGKLKMADEEIKKAQLQVTEAAQRAHIKSAGENLKEAQIKIDEYLKQPDVKRTDSGLLYKVIQKGKGRAPREGETVIVDYTGKLTNGLIFDSSVQRGKPAEFQLKHMIVGLKEAIQLMNVGAKIEAMIPPQLGYGDSGNVSIPPNSALIFELELKSIKGL